MNSKKSKTLRKYAGALANQAGLPKVLSTVSKRVARDPFTGAVTEMPGTVYYKDCERRLYKNLKAQYRKGAFDIQAEVKQSD